MVVFVDLAQHELVFTPPVGVSEDGNRVKVHVGVRTLGLVRTGPIIIPDWAVCDLKRWVNHILEKHTLGVRHIFFMITLIPKGLRAV